MDMAAVRTAVRQGRLQWQRHALQRMLERGIARAAVREVIEVGEIIEDYPSGLPFPSGLLLGWHGARPLHVVVALDAAAGEAYIITAYEPDLKHFRPGYRKRKRP